MWSPDQALLCCLLPRGGEGNAGPSALLSEALPWPACYCCDREGVWGSRWRKVNRSGSRSAGGRKGLAWFWVLGAGPSLVAHGDHLASWCLTNTCPRKAFRLLP